VTFALIRDCYECVVLFSFLQYCLTYLGGPEHLARYMLAKQKDDKAVLSTVLSPRTQALAEAATASLALPHDPDAARTDPPHNLHTKKKPPRTHQHHPALCWCLCPCAPVWRVDPCSSPDGSPGTGTVVWQRPWALGGEFVRLTLLGTLQYIPCSLAVTFASVVGKQYGRYHEGRFAWDDVYLYAIVVRNWSQCWALYCLGLVYVCLHDELKGMKPLLKFSAIKLVVLFMWWQGVLVNVLEQSPQMKDADDGLLKRGWTSKEVRVI
jgi:hypothetical protein